METVRALRRAVEDISDDLNTQHGRRTPACEMLHFEFNLPQTRRDDWEEVVETLKKHDASIEEDSVKLTMEHEELHDALRRIVLDIMSQGADVAQVAAQMLTVGRRLGLKEAASLLGDDDTTHPGYHTSEDTATDDNRWDGGNGWTH